MRVSKEGYRRTAGFLGLGLFVALTVVLSCSWLTIPGLAQTSSPQLQPQPQETAPQPQVHPLPPTLAAWRDETNADNYFANVQPVRVGYLIWSQFPVTVYVEPATGFSGDRSQDWVGAIAQAVQEWSVYLPLQRVNSPDEANITIWRRSPPLQTPEGGVPRARSAETRYEVYVNRSQNAAPTLAHRVTILLRPSQSANYIRAAARHELGHALGIWGHSPVSTDALYFSQVRNPPSISARDINTLKRVYEQPTRLGWSIESRYSNCRDS